MENVETNISFLSVSVLLEICYILFFTFYIDAEEFFFLIGLGLMKIII